ncbi:MAG: formylglycine-generating enzyme family protein [Candidatus Electrothrix sp. MAN1_4]|nr:formylglycine-generating enzyme family protein [Candidatus Electrothrix sp. MAN1_4]
MLVVADSCYSGSLLTRDSGAKLASGMNQQEWLRRMQKWRSRTALTSGGEEPVVDGGGSGHSIFAKLFLEVLRENKGILDGDSLFDRIKQPIVLYADQTPRYGYIKKADKILNVQQGDFLFVPKELQGVTLQKQAGRVDLSWLQRGGPKQGDTMTDDVTGMKLVYIPGGCFMMGVPESVKGYNYERKLHEVCVDGFWMGKYAVTEGQWKKIMGSNPSSFKKGDDSPVDTVSWNDAQNFIRKLNSQSGKAYRLPTEAEWEYACQRADSPDGYCIDYEVVPMDKKNRRKILICTI